ncbi:hypothetical protein ACFQDG_05075 [Natronoarchaeum mannanilyticum]|uniref:Uncharacterized protein n=1 Tax=Natronoarchaeum mannanilyticum TaxID=926360 RepID=A0AAV3T464_9EURY
MKRRTLMTAAAGTATAALAGCLGDATAPGSENGDSGEDGDWTSDSIRDHFGGEPTRPECERESETVTVNRGDETEQRETAETIPYPDPPSSFDDEAVLDYVESFEAAYVRHDAICESSDAILEVAYSVENSEALDLDGEATAVYLYYAGGASSGVTEDGIEWAADLGFRGVVYGVDETGTARAQVPDEQGADPRGLVEQLPELLDDGKLVATFE